MARKLKPETVVNHQSSDSIVGDDCISLKKLFRYEDDAMIIYARTFRILNNLSFRSQRIYTGFVQVVRTRL